MSKNISIIINALLLTSSFISFYLGVFLLYYFFVRDIGILKHVFFERGLFIIFLVLTPVAIFTSFLFSAYLKKKITNSIYAVEKTFKGLNSLSEISEINIKDKDLFFSEYGNLLIELEKFLKRINQVAVDKKELEKFIKIMDALIIDIDNVKNEQITIKSFLHKLESLFKVDGFFFLNNKDKNLEFYFYDVLSYDFEIIKKTVKRYLENKNIKDLEIKMLYKSALKVNDEENIYLYYIAFSNLTLYEECITGVILKNQINDETKEFIMKSVLILLTNLTITIKVLNRSVKEIEYFATKDSLTLLDNQRSFWTNLDFNIELARKNCQKLALIVVDIDNFKVINDRYGHYVGDRILQEIACILRNVFPCNSFVARYGGDEFVGILYNADVNYAYTIAEELKNKICNNDFLIDEHKITGLTVSIGISVFPDNAETSKDLFIFTDNLMLKGKREFKNSIILPDRNEHFSLFKDEAETTIKVMEALKNKNIMFLFQPIYDLKNNTIFGYEVLSRLEFNDVSINAEKFLSVIRKLKLSVEFDFVVIKKIFEKLREISIKGYLFLNISTITLSNDRFIDYLIELKENYEFFPEKIVFEIVERDTAGSIDKLVKNCEKLKEIGFKLAIDDFGSGYSSFEYLKMIPADFVKIEGSFIKTMRYNSKDKLIVHAITNICKIHNVSVIAEYIEDEEVFSESISLGIDLGQGFYLGKPEEIYK